MKRATVADLRNKFRRVSAWIENGESVEIVKRGRRFAHLVPVGKQSALVKADFPAQMRRAWGDRAFSDAEIAAMRNAELGDHS